MNRESFNFTPDFEDLILACFVNHPDSFLKYGNIVNHRYFSSVLSVLAARAAFEYQTKYSRVPSWETLGQIVEDEGRKTDQNPKEIRDYVTKLKNLNTQDVDYVAEKIVTFCRERSTLAAIKQSISHLQEGKIPEGGFAPLFEEALRIGQDLNDIGYLLHADVDKVVDKVTSQIFGVKTGIPQLDRMWRTGWCPGWLIVPLAPPKRYKTTVCLNIGLSVAGPSVQADVLYYTCEISQELAIQRAFYNLSGLTEEDLFNNPEKFKMSVKQKIQELVGGNFLIKHFPIGTARISDLKAHAKMVIKQLGLNVKLIVIDYADTVLSANLALPQHVQQANVYKEAIAFGKEVGAAVLMPDRCTAETIDQKVPNMKNFQGAFAKGGIVDVAFGICATEQEYQENILRFFFFINRHGIASRHFKGKIDPARSIVDFGEEIPYDPDDNDARPKPKRAGRGDVKLPEDLA